MQNIRYSWSNSEQKWIYFERYVYNYDESDRDTLYELFQWNDIYNMWKPYLKRSLKYNKYGNCILNCTYRYDKTIENKWYGSAYTTYEYNNNYLIEYINYSWDNDINNWYLSNKHTYQYDENGNKIKEVAFLRNLTDSDWYEVSNKKFKYDSLNNLIEFLELDNNFTGWKNKHREVYSYGINNRRYRKVNYKGCIPYNLYLKIKDTTQNDSASTISVNCSFDNYCEYCSDSIWYLNEKDSIIFDSVGNTIVQFNYEWKTIENLWINRYKYCFVFDNMGNQIDFTSFTWDTLKTTWLFNSKYSNIYDQYGNVVENKSFWWDKETNKWIADIQNIYVYNTNNQLIDFKTYWYSWIYMDYYHIKRIEQKYTASGNIKERIEYKKTSVIDENWQEEMKIVYYWSDDLINIEKINKKEDNIIIFPNPCLYDITVYLINNENIVTINIYSNIGQLEYSYEINALECKLNLEKLKPGIYFIEIRTDINIYTTKLIKN